MKNKLGLRPNGVVWCVAGAVLCGLSLLMSFLGGRDLAAGWVAAWLLYASLVIGGLFLSMMVEVIPGPWRVLLAPLPSIIFVLLPLAFLAVLPLLVLFGAGEWGGAQHTTPFQQVYFARPFLIGRTAIFFLVAIGIASLWHFLPRLQRAVSAAGLIVLTLLHLAVTADWLALPQSHFHSSGLALYVLSLQVLLALSAFLAARFAIVPGLDANLAGKLLLTALLAWAYFSFMHYIIIWSENFSHEVAWYMVRGRGAWFDVEALIAISRLGPMSLLFLAPIRSRPGWIIALAVCVICGSLLEIAWLVLPPIEGDVGQMSLAALLGSAGLCLLSLGILRSLPAVTGGMSLASGASP